MGRKRIEVKLQDEEQKILKEYVSCGTKSAREITRARTLLLLSEGREIKDIEAMLGVSRTTIYNIRKKYRQREKKDILNLLQDEPRSGRPLEIDSRVEANITMIACSDAPEGSSTWTLRMIADKMVKLDVVESISLESVRKSLKKTNSNHG